jgi:hypothetical protein
VKLSDLGIGQHQACQFEQVIVVVTLGFNFWLKGLVGREQSRLMLLCSWLTAAKHKAKSQSD